MTNYKIDVPVLLVFFNRPNVFRKVFNAVKSNKPSKLFLVCDGPRQGRGDEIGIEKCKEIAKNIDWKCDVVYDYSDSNMGCGRRVSSGITNAFKYVDRLIILEDDCVPNSSFFQFCDELLEKYKNDERINMISGMNHLKEYYPNENSYIFCKSGAIWGWATWKRVWDNYSFEMNFRNNEYAMSTFENLRLPKYYLQSMKKTGVDREEKLSIDGKLSSWTYQYAMLRHLYSQLIIVPNRNLITNIGVGENTTHGINNIKKMPKRVQKLMFMPTIELDYPLIHPKYVIEDVRYDNQIYRKMGHNKISKISIKIEGVIRQVIFAEKGDIKKLIKKVFGVKK